MQPTRSFCSAIQETTKAELVVSFLTRLPTRWRGVLSFAKPAVRLLLLLILLSIFAEVSTVVAQIKIYVNTDLEGASGVYKFAQTREPDTPLNPEAREYFMGDLAAVVRGLRDGGATEILVYDGHGTQAFIPHLMEPGAKKAVAAIPRCKPYELKGPIQAKKQFLVLGKEGTEPKLVTKEGTIEDPLHLLDF